MVVNNLMHVPTDRMVSKPKIIGIQISDLESENCRCTTSDTILFSEIRNFSQSQMGIKPSCYQYIAMDTLVR